MIIDGASALIFGGSSGMGLAAARALAGQGAFVTVADRQAPLDAGGATLNHCACDITDELQVGSAVEAAASRGPLRIVINCAGIGGAHPMVDGEGRPHDLGEWRRRIDVNAMGTMLGMSHAAARMRSNEPSNAFGTRGVIINCASIAAFDGQEGQIAYAASKGAVVSMTLPAARELAPWGIRVCCISPGAMDTPMLARLAQATRENLFANVVHPKRLGEPEEFSSLALELVRNDYLNGVTIRLDGGLRMGLK